MTDESAAPIFHPNAAATTARRATDCSEIDMLTHTAVIPARNAQGTPIDTDGTPLTPEQLRVLEFSGYLMGAVQAARHVRDVLDGGAARRMVGRGRGN